MIPKIASFPSQCLFINSQQTAPVPSCSMDFIPFPILASIHLKISLLETKQPSSIIPKLLPLMYRIIIYQQMKLKLDASTIRQLLAFSTGMTIGLVTQYYGVNIVPQSAEFFAYKYFSQSGRHLVEQDKLNHKRQSYDKKYSIHRGVSNDKAPSE